MNLVDRIAKDEGFASHAYTCPSGRLTIGYGRNIDPNGGRGISEMEARLLLLHDVNECYDDLCELFGVEFWTKLDQVRRNALINMRFNLGPAGFREFHNMIESVKRREWGLAARHALDSLWSAQVGRRAQRIAEELRDGVSLS